MDPSIDTIEPSSPESPSQPVQPAQSTETAPAEAAEVAPGHPSPETPTATATDSDAGSVAAPAAEADEQQAAAHGAPAPPEPPPTPIRGAPEPSPPGGDRASTRKAEWRSATESYRDREARDARRDCLQPLMPVNTGLMAVADTDVERWATRLQLGRLLLLACIDLEILNTAARKVPFHARFADCDKLQSVGDDALTLDEILEAHTGKPAIVVVYAANRSGRRFLQNLRTDPFELVDVRGRLESAHAWLVVLTTPKEAAAAGLDGYERHDWAETIDDFIGPRLRTAFPSDADQIEHELRRQRSVGCWGHTNEQCRDLLEFRIRAGMLRPFMESVRRRELGEASGELDAPPAWSELLAADQPAERALSELVLFTATFFADRQNVRFADLSEELPVDLPVERFDAIVRRLIAAAADDADLAAADEPPAKRLERAWTRDGQRLRTACGIRTMQPGGSATGLVATLGNPLWRDSLLTLFTSAEHYWLFARLAGYARHDDFIFGPPDMSRGAARVAIMQAEGAGQSADRVLIEWILACAPAGSGEAARLTALFGNLPRERAVRLASWIADVITEQGEPLRAMAVLDRLIDVRAHDLAAAVLQRLWRAKALADRCFPLAKRLLSEGSREIKAAVIEQMRRAARRGDLRIFELWERGWTGTAPPDGSVPAHVSAALLVELCESALAYGRWHAPLRELLQTGSRDQTASLVAWLWQPLVGAVVNDFAPRIAGLPGLWILPPEFRSRAITQPWDAGAVLLTGWWAGFAGTLEGARIDDPLPLLFRSMVLADWLASCENAAAEAALGGALRAGVAKADLARLRQCLLAVDAGIGIVSELLAGSAGPVAERDECRVLRPRMKLLRGQVRKLRQLASPQTDVPASS